MKRYLVTGGAGFIGSAIAESLHSEGNFVRILDNGFRRPESKFSTVNNLEYLKGDIRIPDDVKRATKNIDVVIHLAYINGTKYFYEKPDLVLEVGLKGMLNLLDSCHTNHVNELYLASSSEVYQTPPKIPTPENVPYLIPTPFNPRYSYAAGKIISELLSIYNGKKIFKKVVIFRPHNVYGPNMGFEHVIPELISKIIELNKKSQKIFLPIQGDGTSTRSFIYITDFVEAVNLLLKKGKNGEIYNIGTSDEVTVKNLVDLLSKVSGTQIRLKMSKNPPGSVKRRCPDISKIRKLGFKPKTDLTSGLKSTYLWYNNNLK